MKEIFLSRLLSPNKVHFDPFLSIFTISLYLKHVLLSSPCSLIIIVLLIYTMFFLNLKNFFNTISNNNKIYTAEDIGKMSAEEFMTNEKAIDYQMENLGIPRESDLSGNPDVVYVHAYTRDDGTEVKAHYRSKPDGVGSNNYQIGGTSNGASANIEQPTVLEGGITYNDYQLQPRTTIDDYPQVIEDSLIGAFNKNLLDVGINLVGGPILKQDDAVNFWNIASKGLTQKSNEDYIKRNGKIYNNIKDIANDFPQYTKQIKEKVKAQFDQDDVPGIVFHENSSVAQAISKSQELNDFIYKNANALKSGKKVTGSLGFTSNNNLHNAFGKVDILSAKLKGKYIDVILLDTYDFNPNEKNPLVEIGYSAQKAGLLKPYYTIVKCKYKI